MSRSKRDIEDLEALHAQAIQIGLDSEVLSCCEAHDEVYHDTIGTDDAVELGVQKFNAGEFDGFNSAEHVKEFIEETINDLGDGCSRCENSACND